MKMSSPTRTESKKEKWRCAASSLSCGSEVTVARTTGIPRVANENAIWLQRTSCPSRVAGDDDALTAGKTAPQEDVEARHPRRNCFVVHRRFHSMAVLILSDRVFL